MVSKCANLAIQAGDDAQIICKSTKKPAHWWHKHILVDEQCQDIGKSYSAWDRNTYSLGYWETAWNHFKTQPFLGYGANNVTHNIPFNQTVNKCAADQSKQKILSNKIVLIVESCYLKSDAKKVKMPCLFTAYPVVK